MPIEANPYSFRQWIYISLSCQVETNGDDFDETGFRRHSPRELDVSENSESRVRLLTHVRQPANEPPFLPGAPRIAPITRTQSLKVYLASKL